MTHRWWFVALTASGIFTGHMTFDAFIYIGVIGVGCYALTAWAVAAASFGVVAWRMRARNILRWWHVVLVFAIGGSSFVGQGGVTWPICIPGLMPPEMPQWMGTSPGLPKIFNLPDGLKIMRAV